MAEDNQDIIHIREQGNMTKEEETDVTYAKVSIIPLQIVLIEHIIKKKPTMRMKTPKRIPRI